MLDDSPPTLPLDLQSKNSAPKRRAELLGRGQLEPQAWDGFFPMPTSRVGLDSGVLEVPPASLSNDHGGSPFAEVVFHHPLIVRGATLQGHFPFPLGWTVRLLLALNLGVLMSSPRSWVLSALGIFSTYPRSGSSGFFVGRVFCSRPPFVLLR